MSMPGRSVPAPAELVTLGSLYLNGVAYRRPTGLVFLAYLLLEGPSSRSHMARLFWPQAQDASASLRVMVSLLRSALPAQSLRTDGPLLSAHLACDALPLLGPATDAGVHYPGPFLHGVALSPAAVDLQEWVLDMRERLALGAQLRLIGLARDARTAPEAEHHLEACLRLPGAAPLSVELLHQLLELAPPGGRAAGLVREDLRELGAPAPVPRRAPEPREALLGRTQELKTLLAWIRAGERVCEVSGPAGIGKTALLRVLGQELAPTFAQVVTLDLDALPDAATAAEALAAALEVTLPPRTRVWAALAQALDTRQVLVILDGAEKVDRLAEGLAELVAGAPKLQLVWSGQHSRVPGARRLLLSGLPTASADSDLDAVLGAPSTRLFLQAAGQLPQAQWSEADLRTVAAITRALEGHPLSLRLAALQLSGEALSLGALYDLILNDQLIARPMQQLYQRVQQRLSPGLRRALAALAVLPVLQQADATAILGITALQAAQLQATGLLVQQPGRLGLLPALRGVARPTLQDEGALREVHADYFLQHLADWAPGSRAACDAEPHIAEAILTRLRSGTVQAAPIEWLMTHYDLAGRVATGQVVFARMAAPAQAQGGAVQAAVGVGRAWLAFRSARFQDAERHARHLIAGVGPDTREARMKGYNILSAVMTQQSGRMAEVAPVLEQAIRLARELGDRARERVYLGNLCTVLTHEGHYAEARDILNRITLDGERAGGLEEGRHLFRDLELRFYLGETGPAITQDVQELLARLPDLQAEPLQSLALLLRGRIEVRDQQAGAAAQTVAQLRAVLQRRPEPTLDIAVLVLEAEVQFLQAETPAARRLLLEAGALCQARQEVTGLLEVLLLVAWDLRWHDALLSRQVAQAVWSQPHAEAAQRTRAQDLGAGPAPSVFGGSSWQLWDEVTQWYAQHS